MADRLYTICNNWAAGPDLARLVEDLLACFDKTTFPHLVAVEKPPAESPASPLPALAELMRLRGMTTQGEWFGAGE